jgi:uncharacterized protein YifE (UPF0438 family)
VPLGIISHIIEVYVAKHNVYASPNISAIKSSEMRWDKYMAHTKQTKNIYTLVENLKERDRLADLGLH